MAAGRNAFFEDFRALIDQCQKAAIEDFPCVDLAAAVAQPLRNLEHPFVHQWVMLGLSTAGSVAVVSRTGFLSQAAEFAQGVVDLHQGRVHALPGQVTRAPLQIDADHVIHAERAHGETKLLQRLVHLLR
ncbi:hypothetical protein D3C85_1510240 [compost metagenome]